MVTKADQRTKDWLMVASPWYNLAAVFLYVFTVKFAGPKFMQTREPFNIRGLMVVYNFGMVALSGYMVWEFLWAGWLTPEYSIIGCQPVDYSTTPNAMRMASVGWWYFISKYIEFCDTIFFVVRKKQTHVSFLHVTHHSAMPLFIWLGMKWVPGGFGSFFCMLNSTVHFVMYFYYGVAALGPRFHKYLWWKKYMTIFQLVQFTLMFAHASQQFFIKDCAYPIQFGIWINILSGFFFYLFMGYYIKEYHVNPNILAKKSAKNSVSNGVTNGHVPHSNGVVHGNGKHESNGSTTRLRNRKVMANGYSHGESNGHTKNRE